MNYSICRFTLDIEKLHSQVSVPVSQGDTAKTFHISLKDGREPYFISTGCTAVLSIVRPSGTFLQAWCTILDNTIVKYDFSENENTAIEEGVHDCELTLYGLDGGQLSTAWFTMVVNARVVNTDNLDITDEDRDIIQTMILKEAARQEAEALRVTEEAKRVTAEELREKTVAEKLAQIQDGDNAFFRYSAYADGTDFTDTWSEGLNYIGVASSKECPTDKSGFVWSLFKGAPGNDVESITNGEAVADDTYTTTPITVIKTDGQTASFVVKAKNGTDGKDGIAGLFVGTKAEYEAAYDAGEILVGTVVVITDEGDYITTALLGQAILGQMILGTT